MDKRTLVIHVNQLSFFDKPQDHMYIMYHFMVFFQCQVAESSHLPTSRQWPQGDSQWPVKPRKKSTSHHLRVLPHLGLKNAVLGLVAKGTYGFFGAGEARNENWNFLADMVPCWKRNSSCRCPLSCIFALQKSKYLFRKLYRAINSQDQLLRNHEKSCVNM